MPSPTPWSLNAGRSFTDANGEYIGHLARTSNNKYFSPVRSDEDAKLIMNAVNAYVPNRHIAFKTLPEYEGWSNYPTFITWHVMTATQVWASTYDQLVNTAKENGTDRHQLAANLKEAFEYRLDPTEVLKSGRNPAIGLAMDLLSWATEYINWLEIAENALQSV